MQRTAYGYLNLKPEEFWALTLKEYNLMIEGYYQKQDDDWQKLSQLASWIIQPHVKKRITADKLYVPASHRKKTTPEETQEVLEDLAEDFGLPV